MTGQYARLGSPTRYRCRSSHNSCDGSFPTCLNSKRISDLLVGVKHDSEGLAHRLGRQVLHELGADDTTLAVRGSNLSPDGFVVDSSLSVLSPVDVGNALAVVMGARLAVLAILNVQQSGVFCLCSLASLEAQEDRLRVKSTQCTEQDGQQKQQTYLTGCIVVLDFDFVSMSTFNLILMY